jgi:phage gp29-like protein
MSQTENVARPEIGREVATTDDGIDITRGYVGPLLQPYDSLLRNRGGGDLLIYEQVMSDPEVKSTFAQRQLAVTSCEWQVDAASDSAVDKSAADFLREQIEQIDFDDLTTKMQYGVFYGYSAAEIIYGIDGSRVVFDSIKVRNRRRFRFGKEGDLRLLTMQQMHQGVPCEAPYFWHFATGADNDDEAYGMGLAHWLYWPVFFKRNGIKFWLIFLEKFASPTAIGKFPPTANQDEKSRLLQALRAIQTDSGIITPESMTIELLEAARSGTSDYKAMIDQMDAMIQKVTLGQTASTQGTAGKLGNDELQGDVRADIIKADADLICESFNLGPVKWLTEWNFPGAQPPRVYRITEEPEDLTARADRDTKVKQLGFRPTLKYVQETYGEEWEEAPEPTPQDEPAVPGQDKRPGAQFAEPGTAANPTDPAARMASQLDRQIAPGASKWIKQIREAVDRAQSLQELREYLLRLAPDMSLDEYADAMAQALTAATLAGRYEVTEEIRKST